MQRGHDVVGVGRSGRAKWMCTLRAWLPPHRATPAYSQGIKDYGDLQTIDQETPTRVFPGDLLIHHAMTIHRADANRSANRQRRALGFIYYGVDAKQDHLAHAAYQQRLKRELKHTDRI
jgi:phytanoyl-CoA hydroxylase